MLRRAVVLAIEECLEDVPRSDWPLIPLLLCVAEPERPGRPEGLDSTLLSEIQEELGESFAPESIVISRGRTGAVVALERARHMLYERNTYRVLVAGTDSLLNAETLDYYQRQDRLLTSTNSNGFMPGEAAGALLMARPIQRGRLSCAGIGFGVERSTINSEQPLRAHGLSQAIRNALAEAGCEMRDIDMRVTDLSGEHYYFKEAALALGRTLRGRRNNVALWHPAECVGETGAAAGFIALAVAEAACRKGYATGPGILGHFADDGGQRAAVVLRLLSA
jgi:3-oxoacyl-[acyl-carrier-protein] synthase-1